MKTKELRIGNYLLHDGYFIKSYGLDGFLNIIKNIDNYEPIPLTEEWLLKFGFEQVGFNYYLNGFKIFFDSDSYFYELRDEGMMDKHLEYLHQLQNLYFALTNQEL
jgi:hypothetical protein